MMTQGKKMKATLLGLLTSTVLSDGAVQVYRTNQKDEKLASLPDLDFTPYVAKPNVTVAVIDASKKYQTIEGFGGAFTDSSSYVFKKLSAQLQDDLIGLYFGDDGIGYSMGRTTIGSCDFSVTKYNYNDVKDDFNMDHFSIAHDEDAIIPFIKRAKAAVEGRDNGESTLKLIASPWSAPGWMKKNDIMSCDLGPWLCVLKGGKYDTSYALYLSKYLDSYNATGLPIYAMTVQNEPEAQTGNIVYEGMHFTPQTEHAFLKNDLLPRLKQDHPDVKVLIYDHNKDHILDWVKEILSDGDIASQIWGTAFHWYTGPYFENLAQAHALFPNHVLFSTEATSPKQAAHSYNNPDWSKGEFYATELLGDLMNWSVGFIDWNLLLDDVGGPNHSDPTGGLCEGVIKCGSDAMIIADLKNMKLYPQAFYYYVGHVSKFVPSGSVRIDIQVNTPAAIQTAAFLTPKDMIILVAMNKLDASVPLVIQDVDLGLGVGVSTDLPSHSIQTFLFPLTHKVTSSSTYMASY